MTNTSARRTNSGELTDGMSNAQGIKIDQIDLTALDPGERTKVELPGTAKAERIVSKAIRRLLFLLRCHRLSSGASYA